MSEEIKPEGQAPSTKQKPGASEDENYLQSLRDEASKYRTERNELKSKVESLSEQVSKFSDLESLIKKTLGENEDPEKVITSLKSENHKLKLERTFSKVAKQHDADEDLALAYLEKKGLLKGVDVSDEAALSELVKKAVEEKSNLRLTQPRKTGDNGAEKSDTGGFDMNAFIRKSVRN